MNALTLFKATNEVVPVIINPYTQQAEHEPFHEMIRDICTRTVRKRFLWQHAYPQRTVLTYWDEAKGEKEPATLVFRATRPTGEKIVVKVRKLQRLPNSTPEEEFERNMYEVYFCQKLCRGTHPHVVRFYEAWAYEKTKEIFIEMDEAGDSLEDLIFKCHGKVPQPLIAKYMRQALSALAYVHGAAVIHCDVKPANLLVRNGCLRLADFGMSRETGKPYAAVPASRHAINARGYIPYELLVAEHAPVTCAVDVYALGCVFITALAGDLTVFSAGASDPAVALSDICAFSGGGKTPPVGLAAFFPGLPAGAALHNLLARMMHWDQTRRIVAAAAQQHEYFYTQPNPEIENIQ